MIVQREKWQYLSKPPGLDTDEVHIWRVFFNHDSASLYSLFNLLSDAERQRARNYRFKKDRERFIATRGTLREILGSYLSILPGEIRFSYNRFGKPSLNANQDMNSLRFTVSHSRGMALFAISRAREVGIDVEFINKEFEFPEVAGRFFSSSEVSALKLFPSDLQSAAFYSCWTRKEAYIKALGKGLSHSLKKFTASLILNETTPLLHIGDFGEFEGWTVVSLFPAADYVAALVIAGSTPKIRQLQWIKTRVNF